MDLKIQNKNNVCLSKGETPGPEASITKIVSANKLQDIGNFGMDSLDMAGMLKTDDQKLKAFKMLGWELLD